MFVSVNYHLYATCSSASISFGKTEVQLNELLPGNRFAFDIPRGHVLEAYSLHLLPFSVFVCFCLLIKRHPLKNREVR